MFKHLFLFVFFLMLAGGICAVGNNKIAATPCGVKKVNKSIKCQQRQPDVLKSKYWIIAVIFRQ